MKKDLMTIKVSSRPEYQRWTRCLNVGASIIEGMPGEMSEERMGNIMYGLCQKYFEKHGKRMLPITFEKKGESYRLFLDDMEYDESQFI